MKRAHWQDSGLFSNAMQRSGDIYSAILSDFCSEPSELFSFIRRHALTPFIYRNPEALTKEIFAKVRQSHEYLLRKNLFMMKELIEIERLFGENGIDTIHFKGPTLSYLLYGNIFMREFGDLDILIEESERERAVEILESRGYEESPSTAWRRKKIRCKGSKDISLLNREKGIAVELHWRLFDRHFPVQMDMRRIWSGRRELNMGTHTFHTLDRESMLLYLSIHGAKHFWSRIGWIADIDALIRQGELDWEKMERGYGSICNSPIFLFAPYISHRLFATPLPPAIERKIDTKIEILEDFEEFVYSNWRRERGMVARVLAMMALLQRPWEKSLYFKRVVLEPTANEYALFDLPPSLHFLYYLVRPLRLMKKYLSAFVGR